MPTSEERVEEILAMPCYRTRRALATQLEGVVQMGFDDVLRHQQEVRDLVDSDEARERRVEVLERELGSLTSENTANQTEMYLWQGQALAYRRVMRDLLENDGMELL